MDLSAEGLAFLVRWEGRRNRAYEDQLGHCTVGIGHLLHHGACTDEERARVWTDAEVDDLFRFDVARFVEAVNRYVTVPLTQRQFDALVSFAFNWGIGAATGFRATSVLRLVNAGEFTAAAADLIDGRGPNSRRYDKGIEGVRNRRKAEAAWLRDRGRMSNLPPAPPDEDALSGCCNVCSSLFHATEAHPGSAGGVTAAARDEAANGWPEGYDPAEFDRLTGRKP